jgi:DNA-binding transcriptional LysR family regulator
MQFPEWLQVFCDIVRYRSFSQAAQANDRTQSAVSQIVSELERRLEVRLIDRSTRPLRLTAAGQAYYDGCKPLVEQYLELEATVRRGKGEVVGSVQVAAIYSVGLGDMGHLVERFAALEPRALVHVEYLHPDRVYEKVRDGTADLGLVSFPRKARDLEAVPWREEVMVLACAPAHPLAQQKGIRPAQLEGEKFVGFDRELAIRRQVDRFLRVRGVTVEVALEFDNIENIKKAVEISAGVALLPEPTLRREVQAGTLVAVPLAGCRFVRPLGVIHRRQPRPSPCAQRFVELLRAESLSANGDGSGAFAGGTRNNGSQKGRNGAPRPPHKDS